MKYRILIVEDQARERDALARLLRTEGYEPITAANCTDALQHLSQPLDAVISDLRLGQESGVDLLRKFKAEHPDVPFLMVTAYGEVTTAVGSLKLGADDYLQKPLNPETLILQLKQLLSSRSPTVLAEIPAATDNAELNRIVGASAVMSGLKESIRRVADVNSMVLITGESGTGKELVAAAIHSLGPRASRAFVAVNIAAIPESLVESEFFGAVKGAFTGADTDRLGRFEAADQGTLFIDEIGDLPLAAQAKFLRVLENLTITPVGSNEDRKVDARVIAATSRDLAQMVEQNMFRQDLFYRLNLLTIEIPPLRDRREDIPILINQFLNDCRVRFDRPDVELSVPLREMLSQHSWPGNVRQLRNTIEHMFVLGRQNPLSVEDLPAFFFDKSEPRPLSTFAAEAPLQDLEREAIRSALARFNGNRTHAAEALGISVRTLQRKLKLWSIPETP